MYIVGTTHLSYIPYALINVYRPQNYIVKPGFHIIVSNVRIVSVAEFLVTQSGRKDRTRFYREDRVASDVRIV